MDNNEAKDYLECERWWIFALLMAAAGYLGGFTFNLRGGVFCNAQTANFVFMAVEMGKGNWAKAAYFLIPISAYFMGAVLSEILPNIVKKGHILRWDTLLIGIEMLVIFALGFVPDTAPFQISQVTVNFICSMQYNTFRQAQGIPMATTFCTNHLRQTGVNLTKWIRGKGDSCKNRFLIHCLMLTVFVLGGMVSSALGSRFGGKSVWGASLLMAVAFCDLLYADLKKEKGQLDRKPLGH